MRHRVVATVGVVSLLLAVSSSVGVGANSAPLAASATTEPTVDLNRDATLRYAANVQFEGYDPHLATSPVTPQPFERPMYDGLLRYDGNMTVQPMLATSYEFSDDLLTLTMTLRDDVNFWDGSHFDATVAKANLERAKRLLPASAGASLDTLESVDVVDPRTIVVHLSEPSPTLLDSLASFAGMVVNPTAVTTDDVSDTPSGSGPYMPMVDEVNQTTFVLERFEGYWDPDAAKVARIEITTVRDNVTRLNAIVADQTDIAVLSAGDITAAENAATADSDLEVATIYGYAATIVAMNIKADPALENPDVRRALSLAIDREAINDELLVGICPPTVQPFAPSVVGHVDALDENIEYNPDEARSLLEAAGVTDLTLKLVSPNTAPYDAIGQVLQAQFADIGVNVEIELSPSSGATFAEGNTAINPTVLTTGATPAAALQNYLSRTLQSVPSDLQAEIDAAFLLDQGSPEAKAAYEAISTELATTPVNLILCQQPSVVIYRSSLVGVDELPFIRVSQIFDPSTLGIANG